MLSQSHGVQFFLGQARGEVSTKVEGTLGLGWVAREVSEMAKLVFSWAYRDVSTFAEVTHLSGC
jgi:hypothetical protein